VQVIGSLLAVYTPYDPRVVLLNHLMIVLGFLQGRISCVVHVNPHNETIVHQDCYPEVSNCKLVYPHKGLIELKRLSD